MIELTPEQQWEAGQLLNPETASTDYRKLTWPGVIHMAVGAINAVLAHTESSVRVTSRLSNGKTVSVTAPTLKLATQEHDRLVSLAEWHCNAVPEGPPTTEYVD